MVIEEHAALDVITKDGSTYAIDESQIIRGSLTTSQSCSSGGGIPAGSCNTGTASVAFHAPSALSYEKLFGAKVKLYVWYGDTSKKQVGVYNVTSTERSYGVYTLSLSDNVYLLDEACYSDDTTTDAQNWLAMQLGKARLPSVIFNMICNAYNVPHWNASKNEKAVPESGIGALSVKVPSDCCTESVKDFANYLAEYLGAIIMPDENGELHFAYMGSRTCPITIDASNIERDTYQKSPFHVSTSSWRVNHDSGIWTSWSVSGDFPENAAPLSIVVNNNPFWQSVEDGTPESMVRGRTETMLRYMWVAQGKVAYIDNVPQINPFRCTVHVPYYFKAGDRVRIIDPFTSEEYHSYVTDVTWTFRGGQQISCAGEDTRTLSVSTSRNGAKKMSDYSRYLYRKSKSNASSGDANTYTKAEIDAKDAAVKSAADKAQGTADGAVSVNNTQSTQIAALQKSAHTHKNKSVLDKTEQPYTTAERDKLAGLESYAHPTYTAHAKGFHKFASDGEGHVTDAEEVTASDLYNAGGVIKNFLNFADYTGDMPIAFMSIGTSGSFGEYAKFIVDTRETSVSKMFMLSIGGNGIEGSLMLHGQNGSECVIFPNSKRSNPNRFHFFLPDKSGTVALTEDIPDITVKQDKLTAGANITLSGNTISAKDTTYGNASTSAAGLMSAVDKKKLDGMDLSKYLPLHDTADAAKALSNGSMRYGRCVNNAKNADDGYRWFRIGTMTTSKNGFDTETLFLHVCEGYGRYGVLCAYTRVNSTGVGVETMRLSWFSRDSAETRSHFKLVAINSSNGVKFELWCFTSSRYSQTAYYVIADIKLTGGLLNRWVLEVLGESDAKNATTVGTKSVTDVDLSYAAQAKTLTDSGWVAMTVEGYAKSGTVKYRTYGKQITITGSVVLKNDIATSYPAPQYIASTTFDFSKIVGCSGVGRSSSGVGAYVTVENYNGDNLVCVYALGSKIAAGSTLYFTITGFID
ncbi:hypothetical protein [Ruminococcus callidus]|uniref:hypothetical protein n=1 Tax=Ruminococcus callidus TaxID=40519 RepID=UPI0023F34678|nr:hypothetical protein [Ruminococcus callidus]